MIDWPDSAHLYCDYLSNGYFKSIPALVGILLSQFKQYFIMESSQMAYSLWY